MTPLQQRMEALNRANTVRLARAHVKRDLKAGRMSLADALADDCCQSAVAFDLLRSVRGYGLEKARRAFRAGGIAETRRVCDLTDRQRRFLTAVALDYGDRHRLGKVVVWA